MSNGKKYRLRPIKVGNLSINEGRSEGEPSAIIEIEDNNGGFLTARLTTAQRDAIENPAEGLLIWNTDTAQFENVDNTGSWTATASGGGGGGAVNSVFGRTGNVISQSGDYNASQITVVPGGNLSATEVQSALLELQLDIDLLNGATPQNIYSTDGTVSSDRDVITGANELNFVGATNTFMILDGGFNGGGNGTIENMTVNNVLNTDVINVALDADIGGNLDVAGDTDLDGTLNVSADGDFALNLNANGTITSATSVGITNGSFVTGFTAPTLAASQIYTLPTADGSAGQALTTDGSGILSWAAPSAAIEDADGDTRITLEETSDSDTLNLYVGDNTGDFDIAVPVASFNTTATNIIATSALPASGVGGANLTLRAGNGDGTNGGSTQIFSGNGGVSGAGGSMNVSAANGGSTSGSGGLLNLQAGTSTSGSQGGGVNIAAGSSASGNAGNLSVIAGSTTTGAVSGSINIFAGSGGSAISGSIRLRAGSANGGTDGVIQIQPTSATETGILEFSAATGGNGVGFRAATTIAADVFWTLPDADGTAGQALTTDGAGALSWAAAAANVYSTDGTITANRTISLAGNSFEFTGTTGFLDMSFTDGPNSGFFTNSATSAGFGVNSSSVDIDTNGVQFSFGAADDFRLDGDAGTVGQVFTSAGVDLPPVWTSLPATLTLGTESAVAISATVGNIELLDVTAGPLIVEPPAGPVAGDKFAVSDSRANSATNNITVDFIALSQNLHGAADNYILNADRAYAEFIFVNATVGWILQH